MKVILALVLVGCAASAQAFTLQEVHKLVPRHVYTFSPGGALMSDGQPQLKGAVNKLGSSAVELVRGIVRSLFPFLHGTFEYIVPTLRILFKGLELHVCTPQTSLELFLWDVVQFVNKQGRSDLGIPYIPLCTPEGSRPPTDEDRFRITGHREDDAMGAGEFDVIPDKYTDQGGVETSTDMDFGDDDDDDDALEGDTGEDQGNGHGNAFGHGEGEEHGGHGEGNAFGLDEEHPGGPSSDLGEETVPGGNPF